MGPSSQSAPREEAPRALAFAELSDWTYVDGLQGMPDSVKALAGTQVKMTGYLLPIEGVEALLQPSLQTQPCSGPELNKIVYVTLPQTPRSGELERLIVSNQQATVVGTFSVGATVLDGYCVDIYQLRADRWTH